MREPVTRTPSSPDSHTAAGVRLPSITLPRGGGAARSVDEKFISNPATGSASLAVPLPTTAGRGFSPQLTLVYDTSAGNGAFGFGWTLGSAAITRKTDKGVPRYLDGAESDVFVMAGAEDLVPALVTSAGVLVVDRATRVVDGVTYEIQRYGPRIEAAFARVERWTNASTGEAHWRTISRENVTTFYGRTANSRIADPEDPRRVFSWLICESRDDRGHAIVYEYSAENSDGVDVTAAHEQGRTPVSRSANRYPKRIRWGNTPSHLVQPDLSLSTWLFSLVLDYDERHVVAAAAPDTVTVSATPGQAWTVRTDPFSSYRSGFEVRHYRLCRRALMFHHFRAELGTPDYLVRSLEFTYDEAPHASFLTAVTPCGHRRSSGATFSRKPLPSLELEYSQPIIGSEIRTVDAVSLENLPRGPNFDSYRWADLDGEGLNGILAEQGGRTTYKRNTGGGTFAAAEAVGTMPAADPRAPRQLMDLAGDGLLDVATLGDPVAGFYERDLNRNWEQFTPFKTLPNVDWNDPNLRLVDLTGDGLADLLRTHGDALEWHPSIGESGFGEGERLPGPRVVFGDGTQSIFLADMTGDGLTDLVRITNGSVSYWPSLGYGRFGARVTMDHAPHFEDDGLFDGSRLRLGDIDGTGASDIVYLAGDGVRVYFNQSGNSWSAARALEAFPPIDNAADVSLVDLLGTGTACLVWSSPLPGDARRPMRYVDLMGGVKPHLLIHHSNGMGREVRIEYRPSTSYYLEDLDTGAPWATRLPFPVHCVSRVETRDRIADTVFVSSYSYHHGYYDRDEREFRGFGRVDQIDSETFDLFRRLDATNIVEEPLHVPPTLTRTWFHLGAPLGDRSRIAHQLAHEYYQGTAFTEHQPADAELPANLTTAEVVQAFRAFKGLTLRQEVYALDDTGDAAQPVSTSQRGYAIQVVQRLGPNRHASFLVAVAESIGHSYERKPADPRVAHTFVLETDELGFARKAASVSYPRRLVAAGVPPEVATAQGHGFIACVETDYTNDVITADVRRLRTPFETRKYELAGVAMAPGAYLTAAAVRAALLAATDTPYEQLPTGALERRLLGRSRTLYLADDLSGPLAPGALESIGLTHQSFDLAFTASLVAQQYGSTLAAADFLQAGYVHGPGDADWWIPSPVALYAPTAPQQFFVARGSRDALGSVTTVDFDAHALLPERVTDAIGNTVVAENDYRTLSARLVTDPNGNRGEVDVDELGVVVASAQMGKAGSGDGDTLADPTTRIEYDFHAWRTTGKPAWIHTFARERHGAANPRWQESYVYLDGGFAPAMMKTQAEPGIAKRLNPVTDLVEEVDTTPAVRWVGTGRLVKNNRGLPVKQYEPYFSVSADFERERALVDTGVTDVIHYDALARAVLTEHPNGTLTRVEIDGWRHRRFDANDTVLDSRWYSDRGSPAPSGPEPGDPEQRAAWLAAHHANTPAVVHSDTLGRPVCGVANNGELGITTVRTEADLSGRFTRAYDSRGRLVASSVANLAAAVIRTASAEKGDRWTFADAVGNPVRIWDAQGRVFRPTYDALHRPVSTRFQDGAGAQVSLSRVVYGDLHPGAAALNLRGRAWQIYDQAGVVTFRRIDFKGNAELIERRFATEYKSVVDWSGLDGLPDTTAISAAAAPALDAQVFDSETSYDALNRPIRVRLPDKTLFTPAFNEANILDSLSAEVRGTGPAVPFLVAQDYDAKGQRQFARYGNGTITRYGYDPFAQRLSRVLTKSEPDPDTAALQALNITYDPVGNVVRVMDDAQQTRYFANAVVSPENLYAYDAIYQLVTAKGRELAALGGQTTAADAPVAGNLPHVNDAAAVRRYTQAYSYDDLGNLTRVRHTALDASWTRLYRYALDTDPASRTNRLMATSLPGDTPAGPFGATYSYDAAGNMSAMPHLGALTWNALNQLKEVDLRGGGKAYYVYGAGGQRLRKVVERPGGLVTERLYVGSLEITRERTGAAVTLERETLHIADSAGRIAKADTKTIDVNGSDSAPLGTPVIRYIYGNHLGNASLTTDTLGQPLSYEEYHPYGSTSYRSARPGENLSLKRYRFTAKERDEETGLAYYGARYYAPWLGRWTSPDPAGFVDGFNLFRYARNSPARYVDTNGMQSSDVRTIWSTRQRFTPEEQATVRNPQSDPAAVLRMYERHGYTGGGPLVWRDDYGAHGGWVRTRPAASQDGSGGEATTQSGDEGGDSGSTAVPPIRPLVQPGPVPGTGGGGGTTPRVDVPGSPPGTDHAAEAATARQQYRAANPMPAGTQAQHWIKERSAARTGMSTTVMNTGLSPLQSRNALPATTLLTDPAGGGTRYRIQGGGSYGNEHTFADRGLIPEIEARMRRDNPNMSPREVAVAAGREARWRMTGDPGPDPVPRVTPSLATSAGRFGSALGGNMARAFIPGFVEAEMGAIAAPYVVASMGITNSTIVGGAAAMAAAPAATATVVVASAAGGYIVGDYVEEHVTQATGSRAAGVGAGVVAGAATGALIGAAIGTIVPVLGTGVGAVVGGVVGGIAGFIGAYW
jgi:RHS repeat-associated protein